MIFTPKPNSKIQTMPKVKGITDYDMYIKSPLWKQQRKKFILDAGGKCERCNSTINLHVHHKNYARLGKERPSDVLVTCAKCHAKVHKKEGSVIAKQNQDVNFIKTDNDIFHVREKELDTFKLLEMKHYRHTPNDCWNDTGGLALWRDFHDHKRAYRNEGNYRKGFRTAAEEPVAAETSTIQEVDMDALRERHRKWLAQRELNNDA